MSVGLPGSGLGGVFYLLSALCMPFASVARLVRGDATQLRLAARQSALAVAVIAALYFTGLAIDWVMFSQPAGTQVAAAQQRATLSLPHIFRGASLLVTFGTLAVVLTSVQVLRLFVPQVKPAANTTLLQIRERRAA